MFGTRGKDIEKGDIIKQGEAFYIVDDKLTLGERNTSHVTGLHVVRLAKETDILNSPQYKDPEYKRLVGKDFEGGKMLQGFRRQGYSVFYDQMHTHEWDLKHNSDFDVVGKISKDLLLQIEDKIDKVRNPKHVIKYTPPPRIIKIEDLPHVSDITLEDALDRGYIDQELFTAIIESPKGSNIDTLQEAFHLADKNKLPISLSNDFNNIFNSDSQDPSLTDEWREVVEADFYVQKAYGISLPRALSEGTIDQYTYDTFVQNRSVENPENISLGEIIKDITTQPDILNNYLRPNQESEKTLKLTQRKRSNIKENLENAYTSLQAEFGNQRIIEKLDNAKTKFTTDFYQGKDGNLLLIAFKRVDPASKKPRTALDAIAQEKRNIQGIRKHRQKALRL